MTIEYLKCKPDLKLILDRTVVYHRMIATWWDVTLFGKWNKFYNYTIFPKSEH